MTTDNKTDFGDIPEEHQKAVQGMIDSATATTTEKLQGDFDTLKSNTAETVNGLRETNRKNELELARLKDTEGNSNELIGTVADVKARQLNEDAEAKIKEREANADAKEASAGLILLAAAKVTAVSSGVPQEVAEAAETERELQIFTTVYNAAGGSDGKPANSSKSNSNPGATMPGSSSTKGSQPDIGTREGLNEFFLRDLMKSGYNPDEHKD